MFSWLREYRERVTLRRLLGQYVSPETVAELLKMPAPASFEPHFAETDLILVLVEADTDARLNELIGAVTEEATNSDGTVLSILGPLILIAFGMPRLQANAAELRVALVRQLAVRFGPSLRIVHGRWYSLVGNIGGPRRFTYTAVPTKFAEVLAKISRSNPGDVSEHVA
jgi:hypothetical protein